MGTASTQAGRLARQISEQRATIAPLIQEILSAIGGSTQRIDTTVVQQLQAAAAALDRALSALHTAERECALAEYNSSGRNDVRP